MANGERNKTMRSELSEMIVLRVPFGSVQCPADTICRVDNWARWAQPRLGMDSHGRCASAEGRHESEYPDDERNNSFEVDLQAVLQVEKAVSIKLPKLHKDIIVRHFVRRHNPIVIASSLAIHKARYGDELKRGLLMLRNLLTRA